MADRLVQNISDEYLSCPICLLRFNEPRKLPCEHTFCSGCLQKHIDSSVREKSDILYFTCPLCRTEVTQPKRAVNVRKWVTLFPLDNLIRDLVDTLSSHERQLKPQQTLQKVNLHSKCKVHTKYNLDLFCLHHFTLICAKCIETNHSSRNCVCLPTEEAYDKLQSKIGDIRNQLNRQVLKLETCSHVDTEFNKQKNDALKSVNNLETRLDKFHERCVQQLAIQRSDVEKLNKEHIEERRKFYLLAAQLLETQSKVESLYENSNKIGVLSEISDLIKRVETHEDTLSKLSLDVPHAKVSFTINRDLDSFLNSFSAIGFVDQTSSRFTLHDCGSALEPLGLPTSLKGILYRKEGGYQVMGQNSGKLKTQLKFSGKLPSEERCWLIKILILPDSNICVLDKENARLKRFTSKGDLVTSLNLVDIPYCMALLKPSNEIVITKADKGVIEFISTDSNQLCARKFIPTTKKYFGICQLNEDIMAASSWSHSCVDIIDGYGRVLATIGEDPQIFEIPYMLCCTGNAEIIVIDRGNKLTCFEQTGRVKWSLNNAHIMNNITYLENGQVYVCCKDAKKICTIENVSEQHQSFSEIDIEGRKPLDISMWNSQIFLTLENGEIEILVKE